MSSIKLRYRQNLLNTGHFKTCENGYGIQEGEFGQGFKESNLILIMINIPTVSDKELHTIELENLDVIEVFYSREQLDKLFLT
jgi:hypothetical protein